MPKGQQVQCGGVAKEAGTIKAHRDRSLFRCGRRSSCVTLSAASPSWPAPGMTESVPLTIFALNSASRFTNLISFPDASTSRWLPSLSRIRAAGRSSCCPGFKKGRLVQLPAGAAQTSCTRLLALAVKHCRREKLIQYSRGKRVCACVGVGGWVGGGGGRTLGKDFPGAGICGATERKPENMLTVWLPGTTDCMPE